MHKCKEKHRPKARPSCVSFVSLSGLLNIFMVNIQYFILYFLKLYCESLYFVENRILVGTASLSTYDTENEYPK